MQDKIRVRRMISKETQNFHIMIKQGITWYNLETEIETVWISKYFILDMACLLQPECNFCTWILQMQTPSRSGRHRGEDYINAGDTYL